MSQYIKSIDSKNKNLTTLPRCCENSLLTHIDKKAFDVSCPLDKTGRDKGKYCKNKFKEIPIFDYHQENDTIISNQQYDNTTFIGRRGYDFCVGPTNNFHAKKPDEIIQMQLFECKKAICNGKQPCLRYVQFSHI